MVKGFVLGIDRDFKAAHAKWWRTTTGFAAPYERVVLLPPRPEFHGAWLASHADEAQGTYGGDAGAATSLAPVADGGTLAPIAGVAFVRTSAAHAFLIDVDKKKVQWGRAIEKRSVVELADDTFALNGATYRETTRGDWVSMGDVTLAAPSAPPADLGESEKWIDVDSRSRSSSPSKARAPCLRRSSRPASATRRTRRRTTPRRPARSASRRST